MITQRIYLNIAQEAQSFSKDQHIEMAPCGRDQSTGGCYRNGQGDSHVEWLNDETPKTLHLNLNTITSVKFCV